MQQIKELSLFPNPDYILLQTIFLHCSFGVAHIGRVGSVFMTLSVTIERYFAIWYPLKRLRLKTPLMVVSVVFSFLYNIPRFLEFETTTTNMTYVDEDINITQNKLVCKTQFTITQNNHLDFISDLHSLYSIGYYIQTHRFTD